MAYSKITIEFLIDFEIGYENKINGQNWEYVATRSGAFEITTGTPTVNDGETTAINFGSAYLLDNPVGFTVTRTVNVLEIESEVEGYDFSAFRASDDNSFNLIEGIDFNVTFNNYTEPFNISTVSTMLARSPHYVNIPFEFTTTTGATLELKIYSGDFVTDEPVNPTQTITIPRPTIDYTDFNINISQLVSNYLESEPNIDVSSDVQLVDSNDNEFMWVRYTAIYTDPSEIIADISGYLASSDGYSEFLEGVNHIFDGVLTNCNRRKVDRNGIILLPFVNNDYYDNIYVISYPSVTTTSYTINYDTSDIAGYYIAYVQIDVEQLPSNDTRIEVTFTTPTEETELVTYDIQDECLYTPKTIVFKNKDGFYDVVTMFAKSIEKMNTSKDEFINNYVSGGTYSTTRHQIQDINITGNKTIVCNSGHIRESENALYEELLLSQYVWFYENNMLIPVSPTTSNFTYKTHINDRLIEQQIEFKYAFNMINNV